MEVKAVNMTNRFIKYSIIGVFSVLSYFALLVLCVESLHIDPTIAAGLAFGSILILAYPFNYYWTFRSRCGHGYAIPRFVASSFAGLFLNVCIMYIFTDLLGLWYVWGATTGIIIGPIVNFLLNACWSFSAVDHDEDSIPLPGTVKVPVVPDQMGIRDGRYDGQA
jgi:putative flippase GtrA